MTQPKEYYAFISYKREDERWAKWLQDKLEHYRFPTNLNGRTDLPKNIRPTFRDVTDLSPGLLAEKIDAALRSSEWLIVICSPRSAKSPWVCKEAQTFIDLGRADHIIPFIIEGTPLSQDPATECYPDAILNLSRDQELLGTNINEMGRDAAAIKVVARMFGLRFDTLWQRHEREQRHRRRWFIILGLAIIAFLFCIVYWIWHQNALLKERNWQMMENQAHAVAAKAQELLEMGDSYTASLLCLAIIPDDLQKPNRPMVREAAEILRTAMLGNTKILHEHTAAVSSVAFSPDDSKLVTTSSDSTVRIWNADTGECLHVLRGHHKGVASANFSPDGKRVVSCAQEDSIRIWDVETGECIFIIPNNLQTFHIVKYSPDGKYIMSAAYYETQYDKDSIKNPILHLYTIIWDADTGEKIHTLKEDDFDVNYSASFSPDGHFIMTTGIRSEHIPIWNVETGVKVRSLHPLNGLDKFSGISSSSFSLDGNSILIKCINNDTTLYILNAITGTIQKEFRGFSEPMEFALFSPVKPQIAVATKEHNIYVIDANTWKNLRTFVGHTDNITSIAFSHDGTKLASSSNDNTVRIWDINTPSTMHKLDATQSYICEDGLSFSPNGDKIISCNRHWDEKIYVYDFISEDLVNQRVIEYPRKTKKISFSTYQNFCVRPNSAEIYSILFDSLLYCWNIENDSVHMFNVDYANKINSLTFNNDGGKILLALSDSTIRILDVNTLNEYVRICGHTGVVQYATMSPKSDIILSVSTDSTIRLWDAECGSELCEKVWETASGIDFPAIGFSPDGNYIALSCSDTIQLWDNKLEECIRTFVGHSKTVNSLSFSPDGERLVSASDDHTLRVWDVKTGECLDILTANSAFHYAEFRCDNQYIIADNDGGIMIRYLPPFQEVVSAAREKYKTRQLTPEERRKYYLE